MYLLPIRMSTHAESATVTNKCVLYFDIQWKRHCLSLASAVVPMPSFQITVRIPQSHRYPKPQILSSLLVLHNPEYFGRFWSYLTFYLFCYLFMLLYGQLCLGNLSLTIQEFSEPILMLVCIMNIQEGE